MQAWTAIDITTSDVIAYAIAIALLALVLYGIYWVLFYRRIPAGYATVDPIGNGTDFSLLSSKRRDPSRETDSDSSSSDGDSGDGGGGSGGGD